MAAAFERARWSFWEQEAALVPASYHRAVVRAGGLTVPLVPDARVTSDPDLVLAGLDALLLIGGADVDPSRYGEDRAPATEATYPMRDDFEIAVVRRALARDLPVLGVCRGMQILNVALGGTLLQDLGPAVRVHRACLGGFDGAEHVVETQPGTLARAAAGEPRHRVRCHHHQAVERVGSGLIVSARAVPDGVVEAVEAPSHPFALGVQWHPEAQERSRVISSLVDAARAAGGPVHVQASAPRTREHRGKPA